MGVVGDAFWESTSEELAIRFEGIAKRDADQYEMLTFIAWRMAMWGRVKEFPTWESVRPKRAAESGAPKAGWLELKEQMRALATRPPSRRQQKELDARKARTKGKKR